VVFGLVLGSGPRPRPRPKPKLKDTNIFGLGLFFNKIFYLNLGLIWVRTHKYLGLWVWVWVLYIFGSGLGLGPDPRPKPKTTFFLGLMSAYNYVKFRCIYHNKPDSHLNLKTASVGIRKIQHINKGCECPADLLISWNSTKQAYFIKKYHPLHHKETEDEPLHDISENHYKCHPSNIQMF